MWYFKFPPWLNNIPVIISQFQNKWGSVKKHPEHIERFLLQAKLSFSGFGINPVNTLD